MKQTALTLAALSLSAASAHAAGLDRSFQSTSPIFAESGTVGLSFGYVNPSVSGSDSAGNTYDVGESYSQSTLSYTRDVTEDINFALIIDQPYGADVSYNNSPLTSNLGGTGADLSSEALTIIGRYKITPRFSVFGGASLERVRAEVQLNGTSYGSAISVAAVTRTFNTTLGTNVSASTVAAAFRGVPTAAAEVNTAFALAGGLAAVGATVGADATTSGSAANFLANGGYDFRMDNDTSVGYLLGAAYEIPDIALRVALTYRFETDHTSNTVETLFGTTTTSTVDYVTPQSISLDFQTGIAANTLLTASYRWTEFSAVDVVPTALRSDLVNLDDGHRTTIGIARRFSDKFAGSVSISYEPSGSDDLVSPLGPTDGLWGISIGGRYQHDNLTISGGINYSKLGDARPEVAGAPRATFTGNSSVAVGFRAELTF